MSDGPGPIALFGSGETSASGRQVYEWVFARLARPPRVAVLETPAGFQPNSALVAEKVAEFLRERLRNYGPEVAVLPARQRGTPFSPDEPALLAPILRSDALFLGPGSPTYTVRQLEGSLAWSYLRARHRLGAAMLLASAATVAAGALALPVYEIYKSGEDLHWRPGLDLLGPFGLSVVLVPHWDNNEGGVELDTSRCFMGQERFERLLALLPPGATVVGIAEHTALVVDVAAATCRVMGHGRVGILREGRETYCGSGESFPVGRLGPFHLPPPEEGIPPGAWGAALAAHGEERVDRPPAPSPEVLALVREREAARTAHDWAAADALRQRLAELGWQVQDTRGGPMLKPGPAANDVKPPV